MSRRWGRPVHPRERGEHAAAAARGQPLNGSSPRARGTRPASSPAAMTRRFIPASAGNTSLQSVAMTHGTVHPRERGEHQRPLPTWFVNNGSSPRARGTPGLARQGEPKPRFIPASAGNTGQALSQSPPPAVHPRERGEHFNSPSSEQREFGSSPRARGTPHPLPGAAHTPRFIPASAGNTSEPEYSRPRKSVHPRERGEHGRMHIWTAA